MTVATATEIQNNFGKYLQMAQAGGEVIVLKNGREGMVLVVVPSLDVDRIQMKSGPMDRFW